MCGRAVELIEFHNLPYIPADTKCLEKKEASEEANTMAVPKLGTAVNVFLTPGSKEHAC